MTLVAACRFPQTIYLFADCRASYSIGARLTAVDDNLQKLYQIADKLVVGFSGPLPGAYWVLKTVHTNATRYSRRPAAINLRTDMTRWIRHAYKQLKPEHREGLAFLIATVEPSRRIRPKDRDGKEIPTPSRIPRPPELNILVLTQSTSQAGQLRTARGPGPCQCIGVSRRVQEDVCRMAFSCVNFARRWPHVQATVMTHAIQFLAMQSGLDRVGGLFQCAVLSTAGVTWVPYRAGNVSMQSDGDRLIQVNADTGERKPVLSIWEWWEDWHPSHKPGTSGMFEDPSMRDALDSPPEPDDIS